MRRLGPRRGPVGALSTLYSRPYECQASNENIFIKYNDNKTCNARLVWYAYYMESPQKKCPKCRELKPSRQIQHRDSYHVYAGYFCEECCYGYRDRCGLGGHQGNPSDLEEAYYEEDY